MAASFCGVAIGRPRRQEGGLEPPLPHSSPLAGRQASLGFARYALALDSFGTIAVL